MYDKSLFPNRFFHVLIAITAAYLISCGLVFASENIDTQNKNGVRIGTSKNGTIIERTKQGDLIMKTAPPRKNESQNATNPILIITPEIKIPIKPQ